MIGNLDNAYPQIDSQFNSSGLTKRELFAAMAIQGLLACPDIDWMAKDIASAALVNADALIEALNK